MDTAINTKRTMILNQLQVIKKYKRNSKEYQQLCQSLANNLIGMDREQMLTLFDFRLTETENAQNKQKLHLLSFGCFSEGSEEERDYFEASGEVDEGFDMSSKNTFDLVKRFQKTKPFY